MQKTKDVARISISSIQKIKATKSLMIFTTNNVKSNTKALITKASDEII